MHGPFDRIEKCVVGERLAQELYSASRQSGLVKRHLVACRNEDDRNADVLVAQPRLHFEAGKAWHMHVENHAVETVPSERREKRFARREGSDMAVCKTQEASQRGTNGRLIIDDGDEGIDSGHRRTVRLDRLIRN